MKRTYVMANLVYGQFYPELWLENQLKSLLDPTNLPAVKEKYNTEYVLITDDETLLRISRHQNFIKLGQLCELHIMKMQWPPDADRFASRYNLLVDLLKHTMPVALEKNAIYSAWVADLVFAKHALPRILKPFESGHDAVFMVPIRGAADSANPLLAQLSGAPTDLELFEIAYRNLHHLWVASHWESPLFTKMPYSMLWNSGTGLLAHNFGVTPIAFKPNAEMLTVQGGIDSDLPKFCKHPYWATDWTETPVAGIELLSNGHYPPFAHGKPDPERITDWAVRGTLPNQTDHLEKPLYYPSKKVFNSQIIANDARVQMIELKNKVESARGKAST